MTHAWSLSQCVVAKTTADANTAWKAEKSGCERLVSDSTSHSPANQNRHCEIASGSLQANHNSDSSPTSDDARPDAPIGSLNTVSIFACCCRPSDSAGSPRNSIRNARVAITASVAWASSAVVHG